MARRADFGREKPDDGRHLAEWARKYARAGMAVTPIMPRTKVPAGDNGCSDFIRSPQEAFEVFGRIPVCNIAIVCGESGLLAFDLDVDPEKGRDGIADLRRFERERGWEFPRTWMQNTPRGGCHLLVRWHGRHIGPRAGRDGFGIDIREGNSYVLVEPSVMDAGRYEWDADGHPDEVAIADADDDPVIAEFVEWVVSNCGGECGAVTDGMRQRFELPASIPAGCRNDTISRYGFSMRGKGVPEDEILDALRAANDERCRPPMDDSEVRTIYRSVISKPAGYSPEVAAKIADSADVIRPVGSKGGNGAKSPQKPNTDAYEGIRSEKLSGAFADVFVRIHGMVSIEGVPAIWDGRRYECGIAALDRAILADLGWRLAHGRRREVREDARLMAPEVEPAPDNLMAFANGVLDVDTGTLRPMGREDFITNIVPHDYDPEAHSAELDAFLDGISEGKTETRKMLEEVFALCLYRGTRYGVCPVMLGNGANGKSTFLNFLEYTVGTANCEHMSLEQVGDRFLTNGLAGRLVNIGDDLPNGYVDGGKLRVWKTTVTGERVKCDVKNARPMELRPYATHVFSANEMPALGDTTDGAMRRWMPIPLRASFLGCEDRELPDRLHTPECARAAIRLGVDALRFIRANGGVWMSGESIEAKTGIRVENNSALAYFEDTEITADMLDGRPTQEAYDDYAAWARRNGIKQAFAKKRFTLTLTRNFKMKSVTERDSLGNVVRVLKTL